MQQNSSIYFEVIQIYFKRIEELRRDSDFTQQQVADYLQTKREVYRRYEKGIHELPVWALIKLASLYNVTTDYILDLEPTRKLPEKPPRP